MSGLVVAAIAKTLAQLSRDLDSKVAAMRAVTGNSISVAAGCQLFLQFVTRTTHELGDGTVRTGAGPPSCLPALASAGANTARWPSARARLFGGSGMVPDQDVARCKEVLIERGEQFARKAVVSKQRIGELGEQFIQDGNVSCRGCDAVGDALAPWSFGLTQQRMHASVPVACMLRTAVGPSGPVGALHLAADAPLAAAGRRRQQALHRLRDRVASHEIGVCNAQAPCRGAPSH